MSEGRPDTVRVFARFRPRSKQEEEKDAREVAEYSPTDVVVATPEEATTHRFAFEGVFPPSATQEDVYTAVTGDLVSEALRGYNATIFAYGQTGSGKTHSMLGPTTSYGRTNRSSDDTSLVASYELHGTDAGIIPRAAYDLFQKVHAAPPTSTITVRVSYVEIYMERIRDLIDPARTNLALREDITNRRFYVEGGTTKDVTNAPDLLDLVDQGTKNRATASTSSNDTSSRSHSIVTIEVTNVDELQSTTFLGRIHLVDLAGSERASKTHAKGLQLDEAKLINKSLTTLSLVIANLTDSKSMHVPYRDSKLTRLLQDSLGGNARTALLVCCSPSAYNAAETVSTLRFGARATQVQNHATVNQDLSKDELRSRLAQLQEEVKKLKARPSSEIGGSSAAASPISAASPIETSSPAASSAALVSPCDEGELRRLREDAQQLALMQRQYKRASSQLASLQEEKVEAVCREDFATRRADSAVARLASLEEEVAMWEEEHRAQFKALAAAEAENKLRSENERLLRETLVHTHDALDATRDEITRLQRHLGAAQNKPRGESPGIAPPAAPSPLASSQRRSWTPASPRDEMGSKADEEPCRGDAAVARRLTPGGEDESSVDRKVGTLPRGTPRLQLTVPGGGDTASVASEDQELGTTATSHLNGFVAVGDYEAALCRAELAEEQYRVLRLQWHELVNDSAAARLELDFNVKRLALRNDRIAHLTAGMKKLKDEFSALQSAREGDKRRYLEAYDVSKAEIAKWRREAESLRDVLRQLHRRSSSGSASNASGGATSMALALTPPTTDDNPLLHASVTPQNRPVLSSHLLSTGRSSGAPTPRRNLMASPSQPPNGGSIHHRDPEASS